MTHNAENDAPSNTLRKAASLMHERATDNAVPEGRWFVEDDDPEWHVLAEDPDDPHYPFDVARDLPGGDRSAVAEHIASWHPTVALAVAGWLDHVADRVEKAPKRNYLVRDALAVARAYLPPGGLTPESFCHACGRLLSEPPIAECVRPDWHDVTSPAEHNHDAIGVYGNCPACGTVIPPGGSDE